ncbi:MAG: AAA family ATPase, partial [Thermomicrobiales bacterium]
MPSNQQATANVSQLDQDPIDVLKAKLRDHFEGNKDIGGPFARHAYPPTATAVEIIAARIPEPRWAIRNLLPQGVAILAGKPKAGKSWLCLDFALAIASARPALGDAEFAPTPGGVLYLALEDTAYRLQSRLNAALGSEPPPAYLRFTTRWPRFPQGISAINAWLQDNRDTRLVILDTLAKARATTA